MFGYIIHKVELSKGFQLPVVLLGFLETAAPLWQYPNPCILKLIPYKTELLDRLLSTAVTNIQSS